MADQLKALENFILLTLGAIDRPLSILHLEKEVFLLWNFHPDIHSYLHFIKHYKGPYSEEIAKVIRHPFYLSNCWEYHPPVYSDQLSGGYVELTDNGRSEYNKIYEQAKKRESLLSLLTGIKMVREIYDNISAEELLLLVYSTYPEYTEFSKVYKDIERRRKPLAKNLLDIGLIDKKRFEEIIAG